MPRARSSGPAKIMTHVRFQESLPMKAFIVDRYKGELLAASAISQIRRFGTMTCWSRSMPLA